MARRNTVVGAVIGVVVLIGWAVFFLGGGLQAATNHELADVHAKVASDALNQYHMAQRSGSPVDVCVQAGMVSAAYLQANDEADYADAKIREKADCAKAGVPGM